jgi:hypothetical protein
MTEIMLDKTEMLEELNDDIKGLFSYLVATISLFFFHGSHRKT